MSQGRIAAFLVASCALVALASPAGAGARSAYVTGSYSGGFAAPVDLATQLTGSEVSVPSGEGPPPSVEITPDGKTAYVTSETFSEESQEVIGQLVPIDVATNTAETPIPLGENSPVALAISPDGTRAYTANRFDDTVSVVNLTTRTLVKTITGVGGQPAGIAVTPDGTRAYVTDTADDEVQVIDLATNTLGPKFKVGDEPVGIAMTPDGTRAYVTDRGDDDVRRVTLATNAVGSPIAVEEFPTAIAITPDSKRAYVIGDEGTKPVTAVNLDTDTPEGPVAVESHLLEDIAILPDGSRAYVTDESADKLQFIGIPANTLGGGFGTANRPTAIAIVPNQPPAASFTATPTATKPGGEVAFDATASADTDGGTVARYDWEFGDGTELQNGGPTLLHKFAKEGTYTVTLTTTDNEGCSTVVVFPGQTALCNGSSIARTTRQVDVKVDCPKAEGDASSFVPKFRSSHVVPGVRVRLTANVPAHLDVTGSMSWVEGENARRTGLEKRSVDVQHFRRIRYVIPGKYRDELPLKSAVTLRLKIVATPLESSACTGSTNEKTLHVKVVKVIPGAEQQGRRK